MNDPVVGCFASAIYPLEKEGLIQLSTEERTSFENLYWQNTGLNIRRQRKMEPIVSDLDDQNIDVIPLKGLALLETIYQRIGLRVMQDVDILVRQENFLSTAKVLIDHGFQPKWEYSFGNLFEFTELPVKFWPGELSFYDGEGFHLDLHHDLVTYHWFKIPFPVEMERIWERVSPTAEVASEIQESLWKIYLSPYDMLAHMCLHLALHGLQILKNFWDVDQFIRQLPKNWTWVNYIETAENWGLKSASHHSFLFCQEMFHTPFPKEVIEALKPPDFDCWGVHELINPDQLLSDKMTLGKRYPTLVKFGLIDTGSLKYKTLKNLIFPDRAFLQNNNSSQSFLSHWQHIMNVFLRGD